jgi:hypothetical protein
MSIDSAHPLPGSAPGSPPLAPPSAEASFPLPVPACESCGRQDDSLRLVSYPYVVSLVLLTLRRRFAGLWCSRCGTWRQVLASLITATVGWIGIPFGVVFTPLTLFKLARGGDRPADLNARMLAQLAEHKAQGQDGPGAARCLEASLRLQDDAATRARLREIRTSYALTAPEEGFLHALLGVLGAALGALGIGLAIGGLDYVLTALLSGVLATSSSLYLVVLSWTPFVAMAFLGGLGLIRLLEWALTRFRCCDRLPAVGLGVIMVFFALYGLSEGSAIGEYVAAVLGGAFESLSEMIVTAVLMFTVGGPLWMLSSASPTTTAGIIYLVLVLLIAAYYLLVGVTTALDVTRWQRRLVG